MDDKPEDIYPLNLLLLDTKKFNCPKKKSLFSTFICLSVHKKCFRSWLNPPTVCMQSS